MFGKEKPNDKVLETQHKPVECNFKTRKVKDTRRKFVPRRKI